MTIINLMLGKKRGGLEQAALDYAEALQLAAIPSLTVISPTAWVEAPLVAGGLAHQSLPNIGGWDPLAARRLRILAARSGAKAIICHGNRALKLALKACKGRVPIIAVAHNSAIALFGQADHCFAITSSAKEELTLGGAQRISLIPNMVRLPVQVHRPARRTPPVIGTFGRFTPKKGFDLFIEALALLKERGIDFRAVIGGDGEQLTTLRAQIASHRLESQVTLLGWVTDKPAFFESLDMFVLPSRIEAFGIVLIEAMAYGVPIVSTDADGPRFVATHGTDAILVPRNDVKAMADAIATLIANPDKAAAMGKAARATVMKDYTPQAMAERLRSALAPYIGV